MADHRITDFVDQQAIDSLKNLKAEIDEVKNAYTEAARELIKGLNMKVEGINDLEKLTTLLSQNQGKAADATDKLTQAIAQQGKIVADTTNTISRELMERERVNKEVREEYTEYHKVKQTLESLHGSYQDQVKRLVEINDAIKQNTAAMKTNEKEYKDGKKTLDEYSACAQQLTMRTRDLQAEKGRLTSIMKAEEKMSQSTTSSYAEMSQMLELLKKAYKDLSSEDQAGTFGKDLESQIQNLDAHLKDMAADMGEFQRNVGNYAIACANGVVVTEDLNRVLGLQAGTVSGCIEQNKELEKAKANLDMRDASYGETLDRINAKIEENRRRITDVDAILNKEARTVAEAEAQNKQLTEALRLLDLKSDGAQERIKQLNDKIDANKKVIQQATPALQDFNKQLEEQRKKSEGLVEQMLSLVGVNNRFGSSLQSLGGAAEGGNVMEGLTTKVKAFGKAVLGLLANPWVLAFLGIAGTVMAVKWWYDYNKGLIEATKLTKDFTGKTGDDLKSFRSEVQGVADTFGKDFKEVLNSTDAMASQFGITFEEALDTIKDGFLSNADAQGDMLANLNKFAPSFKQAGISAQEFTAIVAQTRSGIFSTDGLTAIQMATDRIRRMPKATQDALEKVGIDTQQMQKDLTEGNITMIEAVQQVSAKLKELPDNSTAAGEVLFNVFGKKGPAAGKKMIESIADLNTSLDEEKAKMGELGELQEQELNAQIELDKTIAAVFDQTGGFFEKLTTNCSVFIKKGLVSVITYCVDIVNWFIELYNKSTMFRSNIESIKLVFKTLWTIVKAVVGNIIDSLKGMGTAIEGVLTLDLDKIKSGWTQAGRAFVDNWGDAFKEVSEDAKEAWNAIANPEEVKKVSLNLQSTPSGPTDDGDKPKGTYEEPTADGGSKDGEKAAKEAIKRINELEEAKIKAMKDGHEKEMAQIRFNYEKKLREITGESDEEKQTRVQLTEAMMQELADCEEKYQTNLSKINLSNRLAIVKKGSKEELALKMEQLDSNYQAELAKAEKSGADVYLIREKYEKMAVELKEQYAEYAIKQIEEEYSAQTAIADVAYTRQLSSLKQRYAQQLEATGSNEQKRAMITQQYEDQVAKLTESYAKKTAETQIEMIEKMLQNEDLSAEERERLETELAKAKIALENAVTDAVLAENARIVKSDTEMTQKRIKNAQQWMQIAAEGLNNINDLVSAVYDAKIEKIEDDIEANEEAGEKETELITELVEKKVITEEEGEARKRASEAKTAKKNEELEKKKAALQQKQAVWDKANSLAQAGIATALAITQALPNIALAAIAGAMGAIQIATIAATPIPKYAKGTQSHKGGLAVVGDAGKAEVVSIGGTFYLTPDEPTLIDMPKGAKVYPDADAFTSQALTMISTSFPSQDAPKVVVNNDYVRLERQQGETNALLRQMMRQQRKAAYQSSYDLYKLSKL